MPDYEVVRTPPDERAAIRLVGSPAGTREGDHALDTICRAMGAEIRAAEPGDVIATATFEYGMFQDWSAADASTTPTALTDFGDGEQARVSSGGVTRGE